MRIGLISDTHGYLGDDAVRALEGSQLILHAGDVGDGVLEPLRRVAPVVAVCGNTDSGGEASLLAPLEVLELEGHRIALVHRLADAPGEGWDLLVFGHCHRPHSERAGSRLLFNPGAAGRRGFHTRRTVGCLLLDGPRIDWKLVDLGPRRLASPSLPRGRALRAT